MNIRELGSSDIPKLVKLRNQLWPSCYEEHANELRSYLNGRSSHIKKIFVAGSQGELVGFIELNIRSYAEGSSNNAVPYVEGWFVEERFRKNNIGKSLMQRAELWASENAYTELASDVEMDNIHSQEVHKRLGFLEVDKIICYIKKV